MSQSCIEHRHDLTPNTDECFSFYQFKSATAVATRTYSIPQKRWVRRSRVPSLRYEQVVLSVQDEKVAGTGGHVSDLGCDIAGRAQDIRNLDKKDESMDPLLFRV